jgi:hypothetical protein
MPLTWRMPQVFGPSGSPRCAPHPDAVYDAAQSHDRWAAYAVFRTTQQAIDRLLPPGLVARDVDPVISVEFVCLHNLQWLAGRGYNMLQIKLPASARGPQTGTQVDGWFQPVIWENLCDPIISGREDLGWAKVYAELPPPAQYAGVHAMQASWCGFRFFDFEVGALQSTDAAPVGTGPLLHHHVLPAVGRLGELQIDQITVTPTGGPAPRVTAHWAAEQAALRWHRARWQDMPTQFQIVNALADVPLHELVRAGCYTSVGGKDLSDQTVLR